MEVSLNYSADEDGIIRLEKTLNHLLTHLDHENVRQLYTEHCTIQSESGETIINGPLLTMYDNSTTLRLLAGYDSSTGDFVFKLYNALGTETISLDAGGNAIISGYVQSGEDAYVGEHLFIGAESTDVPYTSITTNTRGIFIPVPGTTKILGHIYSTNPGGGSTDWEFEVESSQKLNITALRSMRIYMYADYDGISTDSVNSTDYMSLATFNDRMFLNAEHGEHSTAHGTMIGNDNNDVYLGSYDQWTQRVVKNQNLEFDAEHNMQYFFSRNQKFVFRPSSDWTKSVSTNTTFNGTTKVITSTRNAFLRCSDTGSVYVEVYSTFASVDLTTFEDGSSASTDDYIVFICHTNDTGGMNPTHGFYFQLGDGAANYYRYYNMSTNGYPFSTGWTIFKRKIGSYLSAAGNPSFNNISWARLGFRSLVNSTDTTVIFDYVGIHRADPDDSSDLCDFQVETNSTWETRFSRDTDYSYWLMHEHDGEPCICQVGISSVAYLEMFIKNANTFTLEMKAHCLTGNEMPSITWYNDADNYFITELSSGVLRLRTMANGTSGGNYVNCEAFTANEAATLKVFRAPEGRYMAIFGLDGDAGSYRTVEVYSTYQENMSGSIYLGSISGWGNRIKSLKIKPYTDL